MSATKAILAGSSFLALAVANPALAQDDQVESAEQQSDSGLDVIVVTAQKREQNAQDVPISINTIGETTLKNNQFSDLTAISTIAPSVNFQSGFTPGATNFNIRGVGSYAFTGGIQPSVALVIDGVPLARAGEFVIDVGDVERIEILRGPQGTLFGRNSTGGAINITRKQPTDFFEGEIEALATTDEEYTVRGVVSGPISENVRFRVAGLYSDREGHIDNFVGPDLSGLETIAVSGKLEFDIAPTVNLMLNADYSERHHSYAPGIAVIGDILRGAGPNGTDLELRGGQRIPALGNGDPVIGQQIFDDPLRTATNTPALNENIGFGVSADLTIELTDSIRLKSITAYREFSDDSNPDVDGTPAAPDNLIFPVISTAISDGPAVQRAGASASNREPARQVDSKYWVQELRLEGTHDAFDWTAGIFIQTFDEFLLNSTPLLINVAPSTYFLTANIQENSYSDDTWAAFADVTFHVTDRLDVFGGVRYTLEDISKTLTNRNLSGVLTTAAINARYDSSTGILDTSGLPIRPLVQGTASDTFDFVSYRAGAAYEISDAISIYGSVSRGQVGPAAPISYTDNLSFLDPTVADNYEIGIKSELFNRRLRLNAAAFKIDVTNLQASALVPGTVNTTTLNAGDLDIKGFELDVTGAVTDNITIGGSLVYLDATIQNLLQACFADQRTVNNALTPNCNIDANNDGVPETQDVSGFPATNTPKWAFNTYASFTVPTQGLPFDFYGLVNYTWKDDVQFQLNQDDLTRQEAYGLLDLTLGLRDKNARYEVFVFGKNVLDKYYVDDAFAVPGILGRRVTRVPRNATAYFGAGVRYNF